MEVELVEGVVDGQAGLPGAAGPRQGGVHQRVGGQAHRAGYAGPCLAHSAGSEVEAESAPPVGGVAETIAAASADHVFGQGAPLSKAAVASGQHRDQVAAVLVLGREAGDRSGGEDEAAGQGFAVNARAGGGEQQRQALTEGRPQLELHALAAHCQVAVGQRRVVDALLVIEGEGGL